MARKASALRCASTFLTCVFSNLGIPVILISTGCPLSSDHSGNFRGFINTVSFVGSNDKGNIFISCGGTSLPIAVRETSELLTRSTCDSRLRDVFSRDCKGVRGKVFIGGAHCGTLGNRFTFSRDIQLSSGDGILGIFTAINVRCPRVARGMGTILLRKFRSNALGASNGILGSFYRGTGRVGVPMFLANTYGNFCCRDGLGFSKLGVGTLPPTSPVTVCVGL